MELYILDQNFNNQGVIDAADSALWSKKYNDIGECEVYVGCDPELLTLLRKGNYIYRYDDDMMCKISRSQIVTNEEQGDFITATGKDVCTILSGRIIRWNVSFSGTVANFIKRLLLDNVINPAQEQRKISNFEIDDSNFSEFTERINTTTANEDLLQLIITTCKSYNYGFRVSFNINTRRYVFRLYKGKNKATTTSEKYVEFSQAFSNIISTDYTEDDSGYKNIAYVEYTTESGESELLSYHDGATEPTGEQRREIYVDGTGTNRNVTLEGLLELFPTAYKGEGAYYIDKDGKSIAVARITEIEERFTTEEGEEVTINKEDLTVTDYTFLSMIRTVAKNALADYVEEQTFSGIVDTSDTYEYKTDYDLGDIVRVINEYGIEAATQIVEIMESEDTDNGYAVEPIFEYLA